jgi:hypothetical protein
LDFLPWATTRGNNHAMEKNLNAKTSMMMPRF